MIAVLPDFPYQAASVDLDAGTLFALFTDGIPEAQRGEDFFGEDRLRDSLQRLSPEGSLERVATGLVQEVQGFLAGGHRTDDVTLLLLRRSEAG